MNLTEVAQRVQRVKESCKTKAQKKVADRYEELFMNMLMSEAEAIIMTDHIKSWLVIGVIGLMFAMGFWAVVLH